VLEGFHPLKHALRFGAVIEAVVTPDPGALTRLASDLAPDIAQQVGDLATAVTSELFARLAPVPPGTGVIALAQRPRVDPAAILAAPDPEPVVLLDHPSHLGNVGAVVRVAAAAGAAAVLTTGPLDPWHPAALRGAAGLHFALPVARIARLPATARPLVTLEPGGEPLGRTAIPPGAVLVVGAERGGVSPDLRARASARVAIPMRAGVSSLNLATAVAVVLYAMALRPACQDGGP
jgi:RNA methyltransferase, TrmH family